MNLINLYLKVIDQLKKSSFLLIQLSFIFLSTLYLPNQGFTLNETLGKDIFLEHCSGCHINGGNIIRRNKTLKLKDLKRNGLDNPESIARIVRNGIGIMSGYEEILKEGDDKVLANWIWEQSQKAWVQG
tara:strand:- start:2 stop:388 length:387 start_codon:yes stop_codon:yes gene_type:complete